MKGGVLLKNIWLCERWTFGFCFFEEIKTFFCVFLLKIIEKKVRYIIIQPVNHLRFVFRGTVKNDFINIRLGQHRNE